MTDRIADFYPHWRRQSVQLLVLGQALVLAAVGAIGYILASVVQLDVWVVLAISAIDLICLQTLFLMLIFHHLSEPLRVVSSAVNHVSKQLTDLPPPDINRPAYEKTGLKALVQTIYDLALNAPAVPNAIPTSNNLETRKQLEDLSAMNANSLLESLPCGIIALDSEGNIAYANQHAPVRTTPEGKAVVELYFEKPDELTVWRTQVETGKLRDQRIWSRVANKLPDQADRRLFDVVASYEKGSTSGYDTLLVAIDRTDAYATAEEDMDFIALAAHELRGPITVIRGYLDVLRDELAPLMQADQTELIDRLNVSANRLSGYINNILNVSRYDRRHLQLHLREDRLDQIIDSLKPDLDMRARTQNRLLSYTIPTDLPTVAADRNSLGEVISNLVDNAIKYSSDGGQIIVAAAVKGNFVECTVQDFGIGIPGNVVQNLFSKFYRSHVSRQTVAGTGLGLYISKAIVESHGGQIWVRSTEGQGSTFGFSIPVYSTVAEKLLASDNENAGIIESAHGWIKNHGVVRK